LALDFATNATGTKTVTVSGIKATASKTATGDLSMTVGKPGTDKATAPNSTIAVATATTVGTVSITGPTKAATSGPGASAITSTITLTETTYGALTKANATDVLSAYFRVIPSSNADLVAVSVVTNGYPSGASPTFSTNVCAQETGTSTTTDAFLCILTAESTSIVPTTSTVSVMVNYSVKSTAAIGGTVDMTFDGNTAVAGTVTVANVAISTTATHGAIPDLAPGNTQAQNLSKLTITEKFTGAIKGGSFRLIAPTGVTFNNVSSVASTANMGAVTGTVTIADTFAPSDTLVIPVNGTPTISFTPQAVIGPNASGYISFSITDGDINGNSKTGITNESVMLAYADGTLGAVDAGADAAVSTGFTVTNTADGGLVPYTVASSNTSVVTVSVSGDKVTATGKAAGSSIVTVTDALGGSDTYMVTVSAGAAQPDAKAPKSIDGSTTSATFTGGASKDGGASYETTFSTTDDVTLVGTINVDPADQGTDGEIHVVILSVIDGVQTFSYLNEAGSAEDWDLTVAGLGANVVATPLGASYTVTIYSGNLAAGTFRVALAYSTTGGKLVYTGKALQITVE
jgi:hypothetical protein